MVIVFLLVITPSVSAFFQFDNIKGDLIRNKDTSEYGKIEIRNSVFGWEWFQLGKVMSLELEENTEQCLAEGCSANTTIIMYEDGKLINDVRFIDLETGEETNIKNYEIYVNGDLYNGEKVSGYSKGVVYNIELKGKVHPFQEVDWQIKSAGTDWIGDWAAWSGSLTNGTMAYWKFDELLGTNVEDSIRGWDLTTNATNWTAGLIDNCLNFRQSGGETYLAYNDTFMDQNMSDFTWSMWIRVDPWFNSTNAYTHYFFGKEADANNVIEGSFQADAKLYITFNGEGEGGVNLISNLTHWEGWNLITLVWDKGSNVSMYVNGEFNHTKTYTAGFNATVSDYDFMLGATGARARKYNGSFDEVVIYNRTLSESEISDLWNNGLGITYSLYNVPSVTLNNPIDNYNTTNRSITFNCSAIIGGSDNITNISLYHNGSGAWELNQTNSTSRTSNSTTTFDATFDFESIKWNCYACGNNSNCSWGGNNWTFNTKEVIVDSQTYNSTTWETDTEDFIINVSGGGLALTANLWYSGTSYAGTKTGTDYEAIFTRTLNIPTGVANRSFYWEISSGGTPYINYTEQNQTINITLLDLCNTTLTVPYINFTFIDEGNDTATNGSIDITSWDYYLGSGVYNKTLIFSNVTVNPSYGFCLNPDVAHKTLHHSTVVQYYGTGYPQRRWTYNADLTNSTLNQALYLLGSADGIYSIYQVQTSSGSAIPGVIVQVERQFTGTWTLVEQGTTDAAGAVTFWLNPDYDHRFTFTKLGYTSVQETLRPSSSTYTVVMATSGEENATYNSSMEGIRWSIRPNPGMLNPNTNYTFEFNVTSEINSLTECKMELLDENNTVLSTTTDCAATGGNLSVSFNTTTLPNLRGKYSLNIGEGYFVVDADAFWGIMETDFPERGTIKEFFSHLRDLDEFGDDEGRAEFSRIIMFFLILVVVLGIMTKTTGWDFSTQGGAILLLFPIILIASVAGFFTISYMPWAGGDAILETWMQKYTIALISFFISGGYLCHKIADSMK